MLNKLIPEVGFGWAVRIIGFLCLVTLLIPNLCMKVRVLPAQKRPLVDWSAFRDVPFVLLTIGTFIGFLGLYSLFYYVQIYAITRKLLTEDVAFYLLSILNAGSAFGRLFPNIAAMRVGPLNIMVPAVILSGVLIFCLIPVKSGAALIAIVALFGFFSGCFVSLPPTIVVHMTKNRGLIGTRLGMTFSFVGIGMLIGAPIDGAILESAGYTSMWVFGGVMTVAGGLVLAASRVAFKGWKLNIKV